jgi:serine/threonine-protein kinase
MATVFLARDTDLRREVAIKVLFPHLYKRREVVARFQREARAAASLDHANILRVLDVGGGGEPSEEGTSDPPYIVLELVRGANLDDFEWPDNEPPHAEVVAAIGVVMCDALAVAHAAGIVHRDIKPANAMVADGGRVVLADFGVARVADEDSVVTRTGALLGTPAYMSPEQATGAVLDARSDLYSLGAMLYQLATGSLPFTGNAAKVVGSIVAGDFVKPLRRRPAMGRELSRIIEKLMSLEADDRYRDAASAGAALAELVAAAGLGEPGELLARYFEDPAAESGKMRPSLIASTLVRARAASDASEIPKAIALADRVLALDADNEEAKTLVDSLGSSPNGLRWITGGVLLTVGVAALLFFMWPSSDEPAIAMADAADGSLIAMALDAAPAIVSDDAAVEIVATAPIDAGNAVVAIRPQTPRRRADATPVRSGPPDAGARVAVALPADAAPVTAVAKTGIFEFRTDSWCNLTIDGVPKGRLQGKKSMVVAIGERRLTCSQPSTGVNWSRTVTAKAKPVKVVILLRAIVEVRIAITGGDSVRIGGRTYKRGAVVKLKQGSHEVVVLKNGAKLKTEWVTVPRRTSCILRDKPRLDCYSPGS